MAAAARACGMAQRQLVDTLNRNAWGDTLALISAKLKIGIGTLMSATVPRQRKPRRKGTRT